MKFSARQPVAADALVTTSFTRAVVSTTWARHATNATAPADARITLLLVRMMSSPAAAGYTGMFRSECALSHVIFRKISGDVDRFSTVSVSRATHLPANRAAPGLFPWLTPPP